MHQRVRQPKLREDKVLSMAERLDGARGRVREFVPGVWARLQPEAGEQALAHLPAMQKRGYRIRGPCLLLLYVFVDHLCALIRGPGI